MILLEIIYLIAAIFMAIYGFNAFILSFLYLHYRLKSSPCPPLKDTPFVTVQLPIYNELYVVKRLIRAATLLDYPKDKLQIQVLDDSTDETTLIAHKAVKHFRKEGFDIEFIHRRDRRGFKAGALAEGLKTAKGEFIAIFDADFIPPRDFLQKTIPYFLERPHLGMVQTRWGHINADYSFLTRAQALALDGHFVVEQTARSRAGFFINFNGTAGIWRRACIEEAGGWQGDTISEDLDISYRAQLSGWKFLFLPDVVSMAELPPQINAFKRQQSRWAKGYVQCLFKLGWKILTAPEPFFKRIQGLIHLGGYLNYPMILILLLSMLPLTIWHYQMHISLSFLGVASFGLPFLYLVSQQELYHDWWKRYAFYPFLMLLGLGLALTNTKAIMEAIFNFNNTFRRTPKFRLESQRDDWKGRRYALSFDWEVVVEIFLVAYAGLTTWLAWRQGNYHALPFLILYALGFAMVAFITMVHSWQATRRTAQALPRAEHLSDRIVRPGRPVQHYHRAKVANPSGKKEPLHYRSTQESQRSQEAHRATRRPLF